MEKLGPFELGKVHQADCLGALKLLPEAGPVVVITDPPYNANMPYNTYKDNLSDEDYMDWIQKLLAASERVTQQSVIYFPGRLNLRIVHHQLEASRLEWYGTLGWHKREFAGDKWHNHPAHSWEPVIWASRDFPPAFNKLFGVWGRDFLVVPSTHGDFRRAHHPCPKPPAVMRWLVALFALPGLIVVDPCAGLGTTGIACQKLGVPFLGFDSDPLYTDLANRGLEAARGELTLKEHLAGQGSLLEGLD